MNFCLYEHDLFWKDPGGILLRCIDEEAENVTAKMHEGVCGGHRYWKATEFKILRAGYYWPKVFLDVSSQVRACVECQKFAGKQKLLSLPLKPVSVESPFHQRGLDFIGEINPHSSGQHRYILKST